MKNLLTCAVLLLASACSKPEPANQAIESADTLAANPDRLKELRAQCKADHAKLGDAQCNAVAEATRRRFMKSAMPPSTDPVPASSAKPADASPAPTP
jgi:hypothetical protein